MGAWAFIIGLILAVIVAIISASNVPSWAIITLAVLGLIVGLLNVTDKEIMMFLVAGLSFLLSFQALSAVFKSLTFGWSAVGPFFDLLSVFIAPAIAIVAIKALYNLSKD